jgi:LysM repeat protein
MSLTLLCMWRSIIWRSSAQNERRTRCFFLAVFLFFFTQAAHARSAKASGILTHEVMQDDTLGAIAQLYGTTVQNIQKLNPSLRPTRMSVGAKIRVKPGLPMRAMRVFSYQVRPGDTLGKIARRYKTTPKVIQRWNGLRSTNIRIGQTLKVRSETAARVGLAMGSHTRGRLVNGEQMPAGPGYHIRKPVETYATTTTIDHLLGCFRKLQRNDRNMPNFVVGDISLRRGGRFPPHVSHQNGLDVDLGFVPKARYRAKFTRRFFYANRSNMDARRTMDMIKCFDRTGEVSHVFVDYALQRVLYKVARKYMSKSELRRLFQYPHGKSTRVGLIRHSKGHVNHMHLRFTKQETRVASVR